MSRIIHRLWLGPRPMPPRYVEFGKRWKDLNPDWQVKDWSYEDLHGVLQNQAVIDDLIRRDAGRQGIELYVQMADVMAYEIIWRFGGLYANVDIQPVRPMQALFDIHYVGGDAYAPFEDEGSLVVNAVMGGPPNHHFWQRVVDTLPERYWANPTGEMNQTTGPVHLTNCWRQFPEGFKPLSQTSFNPVHWKQIPVGEDADGKYILGPETIGVHHWGHKKDKRTNYVETATQGE